VKECPDCGYQFPAPKEKRMRLYDVDIMGNRNNGFAVHSWYWSEHTSKASGKNMIKVQYYSKLLSDPIIAEYFPITHGGFAGNKATLKLAEIAKNSQIDFKFLQTSDLGDICYILNKGKPPDEIFYKKEGKYFRVLERNWSQ
jgi:hypothetical protein